jgi:hypothetical protein
MDDLNELLRGANPYPIMSEVVSVLAVEQAISKGQLSKRRGRFTVVIAALVGGLLIGGGGVAAATAAGWIGIGGWVDGADGQGIRIVTDSDGSRFACGYAFHFEGDYAQPGSYKNITAGIAEAHRYIHTFDPLSIKMDSQWLNHWVPPGQDPDVAEAQDRTDAWIRTVMMKVNQHLKAQKLSGVSTSSLINKCARVTAK